MANETKVKTSNGEGVSKRSRSEEIVAEQIERDSAAFVEYFKNRPTVPSLTPTVPLKILYASEITVQKWNPEDTTETPEFVTEKRRRTPKKLGLLDQRFNPEIHKERDEIGHVSISPRLGSEPTKNLVFDVTVRTRNKNQEWVTRKTKIRVRCLTREEVPGLVFEKRPDLTQENIVSINLRLEIRDYTPPK